MQGGRLCKGLGTSWSFGGHQNILCDILSYYIRQCIATKKTLLFTPPPPACLPPRAMGGLRPSSGNLLLECFSAVARGLDNGLISLPEKEAGGGGASSRRKALSLGDDPFMLELVSGSRGGGVEGGGGGGVEGEGEPQVLLPQPAPQGQ